MEGAAEEGSFGAGHGGSPVHGHVPAVPSSPVVGGGSSHGHGFLGHPGMLETADIDISCKKYQKVMVPSRKTHQVGFVPQVDPALRRPVGAPQTGRLLATSWGGQFALAKHGLKSMTQATPQKKRTKPSATRPLPCLLDYAEIGQYQCEFKGKGSNIFSSPPPQKRGTETVILLAHASAAAQAPYAAATHRTPA